MYHVAFGEPLGADVLTTLLLYTRIAWATTTPELDLCKAAAAGDLAATKAWIRQGADVNASGKVPIDASRGSEDKFWVFMAGVLNAGVVPVSDAPAPHFAYYHALSCALSAPTPSRPVLEALLGAGADPNRPRPGAAISVYLSTHREDPAAAANYRWLRTRGASAVDAAKALIVDDRADGEAPSLLEEVLKDGAADPSCAAASHGDIAMLARVSTIPDATLCHEPDPRTLLDLAAKAGRLDAAGWLLAHGADPDFVPPAEPTGRTGFLQPGRASTAPALVYAIEGGHEEVVSLLLSRKADPFQIDTSGVPAIDAVESTPRLTAALLDASPRGLALQWALARAFRDEDAGTDAAIALQQSPRPTSASVQPLEAVVRAWLPPDLLALIADRATRDLVARLTPRFWDDALVSTPLAAVVRVLQAEPAGREGELLLSKNPCLPQHGASRAQARAKLGRPFTSDAASDSFLPPPGTPLGLFGGAPGADPAVRVVYDKGGVYRVRVSRPAELRAAGCDAPALHYLELPAWQRAWEYGATASEIALYGMPDAHLDSVVWVLDGALSLTEL